MPQVTDIPTKFTQERAKVGFTIRYSVEES